MPRPDHERMLVLDKFRGHRGWQGPGPDLFWGLWEANDNSRGPTQFRKLTVWSERALDLTL